MPLLLASLEGYTNVAKLLLDTGKADINAADVNGCITAFYWLLQEAMKLSLSCSLATSTIDADAKDNNGGTPLLLASLKGYKAIVELLLATGKVNANAKHKDGTTPLLLASLGGYTDVAKLLLHAGKADINAADVNGCTPLWWAANLGHGAIVELLTSAQ